jgi:hypothetical protein
MTHPAKTNLAHLSLSLSLLLAAAFTLAACGSDDKKLTPDTGVTGDVGPRTESGAKSEGGSSTEGSAGKTLVVTYGGKSYTVELSKLTTVTIDATSYDKLSDVVASSLPSASLSSLLADFEGIDGFKPSSKSNCVSIIPIAATNLALGYVQPQSLLMRWDDSLGYPGCLAVKGLAKIILTDK